jgi:GT2 family glycosyltransferase
VLNHNGRRFLEPCLRAVTQQELPDAFEVMLLDNASDDGSVELVRERFPGVRIVASRQNLGFSRGNNLAIRHAAGENVVLLNNDTRVRPGWLRALLDALGTGDRIGAVTSKLVFADRPAVIQNAGSLLLTDGGGADRGSGERDSGQYDRREEVFGFCGAAALLTRAALADTGLFDPMLFAYYEDTDLSWRLRLRGWRIIYEPAAVVEHVHSATNVEWSPSFTFQVDRNRLFVVLKNGSPRFVLRSFAAVARRTATGSAGGGGATRASQRGRVLRSFLVHSPLVLWKRLRSRLRRRVPDADIERLLYPRELWDARSG